MICPFATYKPVVNHGGAMSGHVGLVLHVQQGNGSLYGYFNNPASQVSAHFWCSKTGALEQYVDTEIVAWAEASGNPEYLSVETEGFGTDPLTPAQFGTVTQLLAWAANAYGFPLRGPVPHGEPGFTPHCNPDGTPDPLWGNHTCPESLRLAQMPAIVVAAKNGGPTPPPTTTEGMTEMALAVLPDGTVVSQWVGKDGTPAAGHAFLMTSKAGTLGQGPTGGPTGNTSIIDYTATWSFFQVEGG